MNKAMYFKTAMFDLSQKEKTPINPIYGSSLLFWLKEELFNQHTQIHDVKIE